MSTPANQIVSIETIMQALLALLAPLADDASPFYAGFKEVTRRFKTPDQVDNTKMPAVHILQGQIDSFREGGKPAKQTLNVWLFVYINSQEADILPSTTLNNCITAVNCRLAHPLFPLEEQTLGGLVSSCWAEGTALYDSGELAPPGLAVIPVKILVPAIAI